MQRSATDVQIIGKLKDLYTFFGVQRSVFMTALNELSEEEIISYSPQGIQLLNRHKLSTILTTDPED